MEVSFDVSKLDLDKVAPIIRRAAAGALYQFGEGVMTAAKLLCPVDLGTLRSSGHVQLPRFEDGDVLVTLGFGGAAAGYAAIVHENLRAQHPVGQAKYLEVPMLQFAPKLSPFVATAIKGALNGNAAR